MRSQTKNLLFYITGPALFIVLYSIAQKGTVNTEIFATLAIAAWMVFWWITEAVPVPVTALLPLVLFPSSNLYSLQEATNCYANPIIFLFMGGFLLALALEKHNLHQRIALNLIRITGTSANGIILGFMIATAFLSMWISNTATTVMMLPIGISIIRLLDQTHQDMDAKQFNRFALTMMLGIAYAANIGGTGTLIGTPPNIVLAGLLNEHLNISLSFSYWLIFGIPVCLILLTLTYLFLTRILCPNNIGSFRESESLIHNKLRELGPFRKEEKMVTIIFVLTALSWIFRRPFNQWIGSEVLDDTIIAMGGGLLMFLCPVNLKKNNFLLDWETTRNLPWGILILFGGGLALAKGMEQSGIIQMIGNAFSTFSGTNITVIILLITATALFLTELMSNVALTNIYIPVVFGIANGLGQPALLLAIPPTLAASCAFMMPVSTPPNAVVFSSGYIHTHQMMRSGIILNVVTILLILGLAIFFFKPLIG